MSDIIVFGGTSEGRRICELLNRKGIKAIACVATDYGEAVLPMFENIRILTGRLNKNEMKSLFETEKPSLVIDATHPYATEVSNNLSYACDITKTEKFRIIREKISGKNCKRFESLKEMTSWLSSQNGIIFSTLGSKEAALLAEVENFRDRVWLRILPDITGISACLSAGFPSGHIICMQGPFSKALNIAMIKEIKADILLTKESGAAGGYPEKLLAAEECGIITAVLARKSDEKGLFFDEVIKLLGEYEI